MDPDTLIGQDEGNPASTPFLIYKVQKQFIENGGKKTEENGVTKMVGIAGNMYKN